ncbi:MAG: sigma-70 family RNA polymerase sigma factor [Thermoanaerobaculia bacterium]
MATQPEEPDERRSIEAAQRDPGRFAELYDAHFHRVYAYVARRVGSRAEAEDLTSEVFHQALANLSRFEWRGVPFSAWLFRIAINALADHYRKTARDRSLELPEARREDAEDAERCARLHRLVAELPEEQRRVVRLRFSEEKSIREVARELGKSEGAVKQLQFRALQGLRARVSESHG